MLDVILSVREAFHNPVSLQSTDPDEQVLIRRLLERRGTGLSKEPGLEGKDRQATATRPTGFHGQAGNIRFADNASVLSPDAKRTITEIARKVRGTNLIVDVRGHASATEALGSTDRAAREVEGEDARTVHGRGIVGRGGGGVHGPEGARLPG